MEAQLNNPVYHSLLSGDSHLGFGTAAARAFEESVSPFAGFEEGYGRGFADLYELLPPERKILYATPSLLTEAGGWQILQAIKGLQFLFDAGHGTAVPSFSPVPLQKEHVAQMMELAALTKPGPFGPRTIAFGQYFGIFQNGRLAAMTGQRLHVGHFTEISAVCTHPDYSGRGFAAALVQHQVNLIRNHDQRPFLHVRADNLRAVALYERLGFTLRGPMNFYLMKKAAG